MKLDYKKTFYIGMAFFIITIFWNAYDNIIARILIDKFGLNQTWSGAVMALDNMFAVILLPVFGALSDRTNHKRGRRTPYIIIGTILAAFAFMALSFADKLQTDKVNTTDVDEIHYGFAFNFENQVSEGALQTQAHWENIITLMDLEQQTALEEGTITNDDYLAFQTDVKDAMETLAIDAETNKDALFTAYLGYLETEEWGSAVKHWSIVILQMEDERQDALAQGLIDQESYDAFEDDVLLPMTDIIENHEDGPILNTRDFAPMKDLYYGYLSTRAWEVTVSDPFNLVLFMGILLVALLAMSIFRSPAVALMPDVTMKPLRSKANAIINLMGSLAAIVGLAILAITKADKVSYVSYAAVFISVGIIMLVVLGLFLYKVREPKLVEEKLADDKAFGLTDDDDDEDHAALAKSKRLSLFLILLTVFLLFMGYNAVISKVADYAPKILNMGAATALIVAYGASIISFIPIGIISTKIGRRKTILIGIVIVAASFLSMRFLNESTGSFMYVVFALVGVGWATVNVNTYPMVVELSKGADVGKYTGYYYTFSMAAQIFTPILSGFLMDNLAGGRLILFPYATIFTVLGFFTMIFVKHGDAAIEKWGILESFDVDMD
ncbi:MAG: MFS transporter [Acholeplasmataceae bacterium]|nr:MFS transporter [Acholeplasmataceae bacterium]